MTTHRLSLPLRSSLAAEAITALSWGSWTSLGGGLLTDPSIFAYDPIHVGAVAVHGDVWFHWFAAQKWTGWVDLGSDGHTFASAPVAVSAGNHIELFGSLRLVYSALRTRSR